MACGLSQSFHTPGLNPPRQHAGSNADNQRVGALKQGPCRKQGPWVPVLTTVRHGALGVGVGGKGLVIDLTII